MERCRVQLRSGLRRSFEKANGEAAPPRLQVIGFDVSATDQGGTSPSLLPVMKPAASSPRSALQQLLLQPSPCHSFRSPASSQSLPPPLPPSSSNQSLPPPSSPPSAAKPPSNLHLPCGLLLPPAGNQKPTSAGLPSAASPQSATGGQPAARPNSIASAFSNVAPTPSHAAAYHSAVSSSVQLMYSLQSKCASSQAPANQSSRTNFLSSVGKSQCASSSSPPSGNPSMRGGALSVSMQLIDQHNPNVSAAVVIKKNSKAFSQAKQKGDDEAHEFNNGNDAEAHEISAKHMINELPYITAESRKSSWLRDSIEHPSPQNSSWKRVQQITDLPIESGKSRKSNCRSEEKSKKSSVFMLAASSPASEFDHHRYPHAEQYNASGNIDFLSACHLCRRRLGQEEDVFMYSGDKAFCSMECRYQQIVMDERKEKCPPPIIRSGASQVYQHSSSTSATANHHPINIINKPHFINTAAAA